MSTMTEPTTTKTADQRKQALALAVQAEIAAGARVESQGDYQAVTVRGHRVNHILHLILSIVTIGLWLIVWAGLAIGWGESRRMVTVDEFGTTSVAKV